MRRPFLIASAFIAATVPGCLQEPSLPIGGAESSKEAVKPAVPTASLDELAPNASGLCLAEVMEIVEYDSRPSDGNQGFTVKLRTVKGSGAFHEIIHVVTAYGGLRPPDAFPLPDLTDSIRIDSFKKGRLYWIAFASIYDLENHPQSSVINFWPRSTPHVSSLFDQAIKADRFKWHPQYHPQSGLTHGYLIDLTIRGFTARVTKNGKTLWQKTLMGKPVGNSYYDPSFTPDGKALKLVLFRRLAAKNEYALPADDYLMTYILDSESGNRLNVRILEPKTNKDLLQREYEPITGRLIREQRFEWIETGGRTFGGKEDRWWRKVNRTFSRENGKDISTKVFRYDPALGAGKRWVEISSGVNPKQPPS